MILTDPRPFEQEDYDFISELIASRTPCLLCGLSVRENESFMVSKGHGVNAGHAVWHHECLEMIGEVEFIQ